MKERMKEKMEKREKKKKKEHGKRTKVTKDYQQTERNMNFLDIDAKF